MQLSITVAAAGVYSASSPIGGADSVTVTPSSLRTSHSAPLISPSVMVVQSGQVYCVHNRI